MESEQSFGRCGNVNHGFVADSNAHQKPSNPPFRFPQNRQIPVIQSEDAKIACLDCKNVGDDGIESQTSDEGVKVVSNQPSSLLGIPRAHLLALIVACATNFLSLACSSLHAPFFPRVVS